MVECAGSRSVGWPRKRGINTVKDFKKKSLDVRQARRVEDDRSECRGFVRENAGSVARAMNP